MTTSDNSALLTKNYPTTTTTMYHHHHRLAEWIPQRTPSPTYYHHHQQEQQLIRSPPPSSSSRATLQINNNRPESRSSSQSIPPILTTTTKQQQQWPRQWLWTGVEIPVLNLRALRDSIEPNHSLESGEVLSYSFGSDRWKVEVVKGHHNRRTSAPTTPTNTTHHHPGNTSQQQDSSTLSLYLTCHELEVDWPVSRSIDTSILISIKVPNLPTHSFPITNLNSLDEGWIWTTGTDFHAFEREREVWESHDFPSLSSLLNNPKIAQFDAFILSIQIGTPPYKFTGSCLPQLPNLSYVPHSILESLESLLDDCNTSDLQIIVTEIESETSVQEESEIESNRSKTRSRKRILYAHSSILKSRSDYFKTMLTDEEGGGGGWAESGRNHVNHASDSQRIHARRKLGLIRIMDFDFVTVYWSTMSFRIDLRNQYSNQPPHHHVDQEGGSGNESQEWEWQNHGEKNQNTSEDKEGSSNPDHNLTGSSSSSSRDPIARSSTSPRINTDCSATHLNPNPDLNHNNNSSNLQSDWISGDPHSHPLKMTTKASAFSIYRLAHRYELITLQNLALTHLCSNLNPATAFPFLLASFIFPELHTQVKAYCLANYFQILQEPEFSRCYAEVGDGLWEHGGEVLLSFTMSLMPGPMSIPRP
ncbi:hypothetical protein PSTT_07787 [Puccinia striiformis]|uniref:BTB domain-containing protein n=1 Tax=Puccinia striiformis TaxID=27350 RepID=A0A2S4VET0_9BASI|nr:hypothetical protein PSTT_07787 [Puccinia striiformis]